MPTFVALLRGINVGGARKVPMADLRQLFGVLGHTNVETYIQSGNVVFATKNAKPAPVKAAIEQQLERDFGFTVTVVLRTGAELKKTIAANPFDEKAYVTFLDRAPDPKLVRTLDPRLHVPDEFAIAGRAVFVHCPNGYGKTKINNTFFEKKLGVDATTRNWNTVTTLLKMTGLRA